MQTLLRIVVLVALVSNAYAGSCPGPYSGLKVSEQQINECQLEAERGDIQSQIALGKLYCNGFGQVIQKDIQACIGWYRKAAASEKPEVLYELAQVLTTYGDEKERGESLELRKKAAIQGHKNSYDSAFMELYQRASRVTTADLTVESLQDYFRFLTDVASVEDGKDLRREAQMSLSGAYERGVGTVQDLSKARYWMSRAGDSGGKYGVAYIRMVKLGYGSPPDHQLADRLFDDFMKRELGANPKFQTCDVLFQFSKIGISSAMYQLAMAYENGKYGSCEMAPDQTKARNWKILADQAALIENKRDNASQRQIKTGK